MDTQTLGKIKSYCLETYASTKSANHDRGHIERVLSHALAIVDFLHVKDEVDTNTLEAACYLHDIVTSSTGNGTFFSKLYNHIFEKHIVRTYLPDILVRFHLTLQDSRILIQAITNHPYSLPYRRLNTKNDLYSQILQDADSLDYVSSERQAQFDNSHPKLSVFTRVYLSFLRKHIGFFLNFPQLRSMVSLTRA